MFEDCRASMFKFEQTHANQPKKRQPYFLNSHRKTKHTLRKQAEAQLAVFPIASCMTVSMLNHHVTVLYRDKSLWHTAAVLLLNSQHWDLLPHREGKVSRRNTPLRSWNLTKRRTYPAWECQCDRAGPHGAAGWSGRAWPGTAAGSRG